MGRKWKRFSVQRFYRLAMINRFNTLLWIISLMVRTIGASRGRAARGRPGTV